MLFFAVVEGGTRTEAAHQETIDEDLFLRIGHDDREAFEELYRLTEKAVYTFTLSILKNPYDTQDIVQETYLKVRAAAHLYEPRGKPLAWLFTIAHNLCLNYLRQNRHTVTLEDSDILFSDNSYVEDVEDRMVLIAALNILDEKERQVLLLHIVGGLKHREIATNTNQPLSTVLSRYNRALAKLKRHLARQGVFHSES